MPSSLPGQFPSQRKDDSDLHVAVTVVVLALALLAFVGVYLTYFCKSKPKQSNLWYSNCDTDVGTPLVSMNTKSQSLVVFCENPTDGNLGMIFDLHVCVSNILNFGNFFLDHFL